MLDNLRSRVASPERKEVVAALAVDLAQLSARALAGEDVQSEIQQLRAQAAMLAAQETELIRNALLDWIGTITSAVVRGALAAL